MKPGIRTIGLLLALCAGCAQPPTEFINANFYTGVTLLERRPRASDVNDSIFNQLLRSLSIEEIQCMLDSMVQLEREEKRQDSLALVGIEKITIYVSPEAFLQLHDTTSLVMEYSYFFNNPDWHDEEWGKYVYVVLSAPEKIRLGTTYILPDQELSVSAWNWGAWTGMIKCDTITGFVTFINLGWIRSKPILILLENIVSGQINRRSYSYQILFNF